MTDTTDTPDTPDGDRLAKVIARAGLASRRDAEQMIADLRVMVNGRTISTPAHNVTAKDKITVDGKPLPQADATRLWLYHKPAGLVTTERDEKDRETVFDALREQLGRVLSVGRLDLTSEGLLLLTNDGELKRRLELPETGWLRRYRVRVNGKPDEAALQRLRDGIEVDGEQFQGMQVTFDRQQGANAWLTVGLREGRNREIRRAAEVVGLYVNRLIRVSYGPFQLGTLAPGEVEEIKPKVLRDQLGNLFDGAFAEARREVPQEKPAPKAEARGGKPRGKPSGGDRRDEGREARPKRFEKGERPERGERPARGDRPKTGPRGNRPERGDARPDRPERGPRSDRPERGPRSDRPVRGERTDRPGGPKRFERGETPAATGGDRSERRASRSTPDGAPRMTKGEKKAAMRADTSVSLRKGGQRGRGISKPKPAPKGKPYTKPPKS